MTDNQSIRQDGIVDSLSGESTSSSINSTRSTFAQCFATFVNSLSYISLGLMYTIPTVVIESVRNAKNNLSLNDEQVSYYASLLPIFQPIGCLLGGLLQNHIGRKHGLLLMNLVTVLAWAVLAYAWNVEMLYLSSILMGISIGFAEAPGVTYVSEITTTKLRGTLVTYNNSNVITGITLTFLSSLFMGWRTCSLVYMGLCFFSVALLVTIPDSPVWLINKGKREEAIKALRWLRGWTTEEAVMSEYQELSEYIRQSYSNDSNDQGGNQKFELRYLREKSSVRPFIFLNYYSFFACAASLQAARNYFLVIFNELKLPMSSNSLAFVNSLLSMVGAFACAATVKIYGKRTLSLVSMISSSIISFLLGLYIIFLRDSGQPWIFMIPFVLLGFTTALGIGTIPWVLLGEIFPMKTRSVAAGVSGAAYYISFFVYVKTFYYLQLLMSTQGTFVLYSVLGFAGFFYLWMYMPETEGKTLAEIEELFADDARKSCPHFRKKK